MHDVTIRPPVIDRVLARRGRLHIFERFDPSRTALPPGSSGLEREQRSLGVEVLLIAGTKTNICCESTARGAMMLDFGVAVVADGNAALSDDEHRAALETVIQNFGDVMTADEVLARLRSAAD